MSDTPRFQHEGRDRDTRLPQTQEELRDWIAQAWEQGWRDARSQIGKPLGTLIANKPQLRDAFLRSWDLPPMPPKPTVPINEAIRRMGEKC